MRSRTILIMVVDEGVERLIPMNSADPAEKIKNWLDKNFGSDDELKRTSWAKIKCIKELLNGRMMIETLKNFYMIHGVDVLFYWDESHQLWHIKSLKNVLVDAGVKFD